MDTSLKQKRGLQTTVGFKVVMAFSGIVLVIFVLFHMYGNLKMFFGAESYNHYAEWLKHDLLYPILPHGWFIWIFRTCLLLFLLGHAGAAACLFLRNRRARGSQYKVTKGSKKKVPLASRTMKIGGVFLLIFIVFHILHFTALAIQIGGDYHALTPYERMIVSFTPDNWASVAALVVYTAAVAFLSFHVWHGAFSALATLGAARTGAQPFLRGLAALCGLALLIGFLAPPYAIAFGFIS
ncbi:MAG: succinate dehydrogenase cytochrome b subunit [Peptidiphaga sp.]